MSGADRKKLLVTVDGSRRSIDTVRYVAAMPSFGRMQIHLFHVFTALPEPFWDYNREVTTIGNDYQQHAWESQNRSAIEAHVRTCREILLAKGVHPKNIHVHIHKRNQGIARDIMAEARKGYTAVVLRRRGMSKLHSLTMGGTALKLLNGLDDVPLLFAGRKPANNKVLIAFDGSENAFRAVDFACAMLVPGFHQVNIASVLRMNRDDELSELGYTVDKTIMEHQLDWLQQRVNQAVDRFHLIGFDQNTAQSRIVSNLPSRAGAIVELAAMDNAGTIIAGRRGHSMVREFALGCVSQKILQAGAACTVWIVN